MGGPSPQFLFHVARPSDLSLSLSLYIYIYRYIHTRAYIHMCNIYIYIYVYAHIYLCLHILLHKPEKLVLRFAGRPKTTSTLL